MKNDAPMFGEYAKRKTSREIVRVVSFDPRSQEFELEIGPGQVSKFPPYEVERITADEEIEFLRLRQTSV